METTKTSVWKGTLNAGLILGLVLVLYGLILWFFDQSLNKTLGAFSYIIIIVGLYLGIKDFRDNSRGGVLSYGGVIGTGTVISLYVGIIGAVFAIILYKFIDPGLIDKLISFSEQKLVDRGMTDEQIEMAMKISGKFMNPYFIAINTLWGYVFIGVIISLFEGIFLKREGEPVFDHPVESEE
ncbi:MAG: DUF4199 domain-containing protein [Chlorobi bacterium]|nr:DUF4199 domain-containing protein [Chlorobiota bacterium]